MKRKKRVKIIVFFLILIILLLFAVIIYANKANMEEKEVTSESIVFKLNNEEEIVLEVGTSYIEYGAVATKNNIDISDKIKISNDINIEELGTYYVIYEIVDENNNKINIKRTVIVKDMTKPEIILNGNNEMSIIEKQKYKELGAIATDNYDKEINSKIKIEGDVDTSKIGEYTVNYSATDSSGNTTSIVRIVKVVEVGTPIILLKGTGTVYLELGTNYIEPGYKAECVLDGNLTNKVSISGEINNNKLGTYYKTYTVTSSSNKTTTVTRTIIVRDTTKPIGDVSYSTKQYTKSDVIATLKANEKIKDIDGWNKIDEFTYSKTYKTNQNESITIEDLNGNSNIVNVVVANIDGFSPAATYTTTTNNLPHSTIITINATDDVSGVKEIRTPDNVIISKNTTTYKVYLNGSYSFKIIDNLGNESIIVVDISNVQTEEVMIESDGTKVNRPKLSNGMIPIKYNGSNWEVTHIYDPEWSDYKAQINTADGKSSKWANIMLSDGIYKSDTVQVGQIINKNQLGSMFVWIPRYAYKIESSYHMKETGTIDVKFLEHNTDRFLDGSGIASRNPTYESGAMNEYITHPVFIDESANNYENGGWNKEISGFWTAKFEASKSDATIEQEGNELVVKVSPNVVSWRNISIDNIFLTALNMKNNNVYGMDSNKVDTHLMKNSEWGAVSYLTHSKYGRNGNEVTINNNASDGATILRTGYGGDSVSAANVDNTSNQLNMYDGVNGKLASSTGNIYGVYDLSGGAYEYTAAYVDTGHADLVTHGNSLITANGKYKNKYRKTSLVDNSVNNYNENSNKFGDAIFETSGSASSNNTWNGAYSGYPYSNRAFFIRGTNFQFASSAGMFSFVYDTGAAYKFDGFRPVIYID